MLGNHFVSEIVESRAQELYKILDHREEVITKYTNGMGIKEIAFEYEVPYSTINYVLAILNRKNSVCEKMRKERKFLIELISRGATLTRIAEYYGVKPETVSVTLKSMGISAKPIREKIIEDFIKEHDKNT